VFTGEEPRRTVSLLDSLDQRSLLRKAQLFGPLSTDNGRLLNWPRSLQNQPDFCDIKANTSGKRNAIAAMRYTCKAAIMIDHADGLQYDMASNMRWLLKSRTHGKFY